MQSGNRTEKGGSWNVWMTHDEPLLPRKKHTVQTWVEKAAERAAEETGDTERVSSHDLRRC